MRYWFKARRGLVVAVAGVVVIAAAATIGTISLPVPSLFAAAALVVPIALVVPLVLSTALGLGLEGGNAALEATATRPVVALDVAFLTVATGATAIGLILVDGTISGHLGLAAARNSISFAAMVVAGRVVLGHQASTILPVASMLVLAAFGGDSSGLPRSWAWLLARGDDSRSWALTAVVVLAAVLLLVGRSVVRSSRLVSVLHAASRQG